jgi:TPR repeat protein
MLMVGCGKSTQLPPTTQKAIDVSPEQMFAGLVKKAEAGDASAQTNLGDRYFYGEGTAKDLVKAVEWYQKAAAQGYSAAQFLLAVRYARGEGTAKDMVKALEWYQKAAAQDVVYAQVSLGDMYASGEGVPKDNAKAVEWWKKAAEQGDGSAQFALYFAYFYGKGVSKDEVKALECLQKAAEHGHDKAQFLIGGIYYTGQGLRKDDVKAANWWHKAAVQGHGDAQAYLGVLYAAGEGVSKDTVLAYAWLNLAARSESRNAKNRDLYEFQLSSAEKAEGQRLSSNWKEGQILVREGQQISSTKSLTKQGTGTAFIVSDSAQAITNHHVIESCKEVHAEGREGIVKVITSDLINDIALIQLSGAANVTAVIASEPAGLRQGEDVIVYGFPLNSILSSGGNLKPGVVSALTGLGNNTNQIQITASIQPGSSGSPVLNKKGEVVGVVSMKLDDSKMAKATGQIGQNINFAVSGQTLKTFLDTNKVTYSRGKGFFSREKSTADLADEARKWTLAIECWK